LQHFCGFCNSAKKFVNHLIKFRRIINIPFNNFSVCLQIKFRASRKIHRFTAIAFHFMMTIYILCMCGSRNAVIVISSEEICLWFIWKNTIKKESMKHFTETLIWNCNSCAAPANTTDVTEASVIEVSSEVLINRHAAATHITTDVTHPSVIEVSSEVLTGM